MRAPCIVVTFNVYTAAAALFPQTGKNEINYFVKNFVFKQATLRLYSENVNVQVFFVTAVYILTNVQVFPDAAVFF